MFWIQRDKTVIAIEDMTDSHLEKAMDMLWKDNKVQKAVLFIEMREVLQSREDQNNHKEALNDVMRAEMAYGSD